MASVTAPTGVPPSGGKARYAAPRVAYGLAYGLLVSLFIWTMIAGAVYALV